MMILLTIVHVIVCLFLILVVLLQQGKSADWSGTFGGGSSQTSFGQRGTATVLSKATTAAAVIFMLTSLALTIMSTRPGSRSVIPAGATAPAPTTTTPPVETPAPAPAQETAPPTPASPEGKEAAPSAPASESKQ